MTSIEQARQRLESANPVPPSTSFPEATWSNAELLERVHERRRTMTDTLTPVEVTRAPSQPPRRGRGPLIALATAAAAIVVVGGVFALTNLVGDDEGDVASTSTTVVLENAGDLDVINQFYRAFKAGDAAAAMSLISPDAVDCPDCSPDGSGIVLDDGATDSAEERGAQGSRLLVASGGRLEVSCERIGPNQALCEEQFFSGFGAASAILNPIQEATVLFTVEDGLIAAAWNEDSRFDSYFQSEGINISLYRQWLQENHPEDYPTLFELDVRIMLNTPERMELHEQYIAEYVAANS
jgi:hypothetical protein